MRKSILTAIIVALAFSSTSCVNNGKWLRLVGRWQDVEAPIMELEFTKGGTFSEYFYGEMVGYGEFYAEGNTISLHYLSTCGGPNQISCDVRLMFTVTDETLIITDAQGDLVYKRVRSSP